MLKYLDVYQKSEKRELRVHNKYLMGTGRGGGKEKMFPTAVHVAFTFGFFFFDRLS